jgi:hypothetical protein
VPSAKKARVDQPQVTLTPEQTAAFSQAVAEYIRAQRTHYYSRAKPLAFGDLWLRFFSVWDLERLRVVQPGLECMPNPQFYADLERLGLTGLPNFTTMEAITVR